MVFHLQYLVTLLSVLHRSHPKRYVVQEAGKKLIANLREQSSYTRPLEKDKIVCRSWSPVFEYLADEDVLENLDRLTRTKKNNSLVMAFHSEEELIYNKRQGPCWMFARKFSPKAVDRIMLFSA